MARNHGKDTRIIVNSVHLSGQVSGWRFEHSRLYADVTNLLSVGEQFQPGQMAGSLGLSGFFEPTAGDIVTTLDTAAAAAGGLLVTAFPVTPAIGSLAFIGGGNVSARGYPAAVKDVVKVELTGTPDDGVDLGVTVHVLGAETATSNSTSVDNTLSSAGGAVASLHVTAYTGLTNIVCKVQHSTDNISFFDLITFSTVTATTWERQKITGTVNRYLRSLWTVTGVGSCTFAMACARR
jgi:hypothetical protein